MTLQLPPELYRWLTSHQVLESSKPVFRSNGKCEVGPVITSELMIGIRVAKLLVSLANMKKIELDLEKMGSLRTTSTPASRLYNWNILSEVLDKLSYTLSKEMQRQIVSGNTSGLVDFLLQLMRKMTPPVVVNPPEKILPKKEIKPKLPANTKDSFANFNINRINVNQPPEKAQSLLQFVLLMSCQRLELPPKQVFALLSDNCNYFAHLIVKGVKGQYMQLWNLLDGMLNSAEKFGQLLLLETEKNLQFAMNVLKPGLLSKSEAIVVKTAEVIVGLFDYIIKNKQENWLFKELCKENSLFETLYLSLKRHPALAEHLTPLIHCISNGNYSDFYVIYFKKSATDDCQYLRTILLLFNSLIDIDKSQLTNSGAIVSWLRLCQQISNTNHPVDTCAYSMELICKICVHFPEIVEQIDESLESLLEILKKYSRSDSYILRICAINRLFDMLQHTAELKSRYAPLIYKKMIFLYLENHQETQVREIVLLNFIRILTEFPTIPVDLVVQPFIKQLQLAEGSTYLLNTFDLDFIKIIVSHKKLTVLVACHLCQFLMKLYLRNLVFSKLILKSLAVLLERYCPQEDFQELLLKQSKEYLSLYPNLKRNRKNSDNNIMTGQKKSLIVEMLKIIIGLEEPDVNQKLKILISQTYNTMQETRKTPDKGLFTLLSIFGIPQAIAEQTKINQMNEFKVVERAEPLTAEPETVQKLEKLKRNKTNPKPMTVDVESNLLSERALMDKHGLGIKKKIIKKINQSADALKIKPDIKVLNDIEKVKAKFLEQKLKSEKQKILQEKRLNAHQQAIKGQIMQRNISLGFAKLSDVPATKMLFDFNSIRQTNLSLQLHLIDVDQEEDRDKLSILLTMKKFSKINKILFNKFSNASEASRRQLNATTVAEPAIISFAQVIKMLKQWNVGKLPSKVIVSEIIKQLNTDIKKDRNILVGVTQQQFEQLMIQFTAVLDVYDLDTKWTTIPLGMKLQRVIEGIANEEIQKFDDLDEKVQASIVKGQKQLPKGYKMVTDKEISLDYRLSENILKNIPEPYAICYELIDEIIRKSYSTGPIQALTSTVQNTYVRKVEQKPVLRVNKSAAAINHVQIIKEQLKEYREKEQQKQKKRQQQMRKIRQEVERNRPIKMEQEQKKQEERQKQQSLEKKKELQRLKEMEKKKEIVENYRRQKKQQEEQEKEKLKQEEEMQREKKKREREEYLRNHQNKLKEGFQELVMKNKEQASMAAKMKAEEVKRNQILSKKLNNVMNEDKRTKEKEQETTRQIRQLMESQRITTFIKPIQEKLKNVFKTYAESSSFKIHKTQKTLEIKGYSTFMKDLKISPGLMKIQESVKLYKFMLRDSAIKEGINFNQFMELLARISFKVNLMNKNQQMPGENEFEGEGEIANLESITPERFQKFVDYVLKS